MKRNNFFTLMTISLLSLKIGYAQVPVLSSQEVESIPVGFKWSKVSSMSDDFDSPSGTEPYDSTAPLNRTKWNPSLRDWKGRVPAEFYPDNVYLEGNQMHIKNTPHPFPHDGYTIAGGGVESVNTQRYGYFEVRMKASKIRMSSTFWLNTTTVAFNDDVNNPNRDEGCEGYSTEIDIVECMGSVETTPEWMVSAPWDVAMASNTHFKLKELVDVTETDGSTSKKCQDVYYSTPASSFISEDKTANVADDFHVYAAWWVNSNTVNYYLDGVKIKTLHPDMSAHTTPFDVEMSIRMVTETYDWQYSTDPSTGLVTPTPGYPDPTDTNPMSELNNSLINTTHYDWIHTYKLEPINDNLVDNPDFEQGDLDTSNWTYWQPEGTKHVYRSSAFGEKFTNNFGAKIIGSGGLEQVIEVTPNTNYVYTVLAKRISGKVIIGVKDVDTNTNIATNVQVSGEEFEEYKIEFSSGDRNKVKLFSFCNNGNSGVLDNFSVVEKTKYNEIKSGGALNNKSLTFNKQKLDIATNNRTIVIKTHSPLIIKNVSIYNTAGVKVYDMINKNLSTITIETNLNRGLYILKAEINSGQIITKKILL